LKKIGKLDARVIPVLELASIIEVTGWTETVIGEQDAEQLEALKVVWGAGFGVGRALRLG